MTKNVAASVQNRLLAIAKERKVDFTQVVQQYVNERVLYRLTRTRYAEDYILKGGTLFGLYLGQPHRPTKDLDLLGAGDNDVTTLREAFRAVFSVEENDGIVFQLEKLDAEKIKEEEQYEGVRISCRAVIRTMQIAVQIDIGFGDDITHSAKAALPRLLTDFPAAEIRVYPLESVISEKFEAIVKLGMTNSRMKDFFDIFTLAKTQQFDGAALTDAIRKTFQRRQTEIPTTTPVALTARFYADKNQIARWKGFSKKARLHEEFDFRKVCEVIETFIMPAAQKATTVENLQSKWTVATGWTMDKSN